MSNDTPEREAEIKCIECGLVFPSRLVYDAHAHEPDSDWQLARAYYATPLLDTLLRV